MSTSELIAVAVVMVGVAAMCSAPTADASEDPAINGTFTVQSNGQWATTNDVYRDEAVVRSTWTVSTSCTTILDCSGTVASDQGWTAPVNLVGDEWHVLHTGQELGTLPRTAPSSTVLSCTASIPLTIAAGWPCMGRPSTPEQTGPPPLAAAAASTRH